MTEINDIAIALNQFPAINELIGLEKIIEIKKNEPDSWLIHCLKASLFNKDIINKLKNDLQKQPNNNNIKISLYLNLKKYFEMKYLDKLLLNIKNEDKINRYINHLLFSDSFWQGYSEIEVASLLKKLFNYIEIEPILPNNKIVDVSYTNNSKVYYVEVVTPIKGYKFWNDVRKSIDSKEATISSVSPERSCEKIFSEINHFEGCLDEVNSIIIINMNESDFDFFEIEACIFGILKIVYIQNKQTGEIIDTVIKRDSWTAFKQDNRLAKIGAVICYKRDFTLEGNPLYSEKIFSISFDEDDYKPIINLFS